MRPGTIELSELHARSQVLTIDRKDFSVYRRNDRQVIDFVAPQEKKGHLMGGNDLLIAAQAVSLGFTLVTANEREFGKVKDLRCENWLR